MCGYFIESCIIVVEESDYRSRHVRIGLKVSQIAPKWDKSGTFSDKISVHFGSESQNVLKSDL